MVQQTIKKLLQESDNIVFFGGAGISTESGIPDFRSSGGLFETENMGKFSPEEMLSRDFFMNHTQEFYRYYLSHMVHEQAKPNQAHYILAELEQLGKLRAVITQNIDGLHQQAGSKNVLELHGSIHRNYCMNCNRFYPLDEVVKHKGSIPLCECSGIIKPDVVLYQEGLDDEVLRSSQQYISEADVLIVGGTSLRVYPAAGLVQFYNGNKMILINKTPTTFDGTANHVISAPIGEFMESLQLFE